MLTKELAISEYDYTRRRILPDRLTQQRHKHYVRHADRAVQLYRQGAGRTRRELHRSVHDILSREAECPARRIDAFCKLLDDVSVFNRDRRGEAAKLRRLVFGMAAAHHPLVTAADGLFGERESLVKASIARQLGSSWPELEPRLFADMMDLHRLEKFEGFASGAELLARYNVAQVQAALYGAVSLTVWATDDFKTILRYAKLARLMHVIKRDGELGYRIRLDGPASVLRATRRYGAAMARFLPALIACRGWRMHAPVRSRDGRLFSLDLSASDQLNSHLPPPAEFDSQVESAFTEQWGEQPRAGWSLERETEVLCRGQRVFVPDFVFRHEDGRKALLEIVGFWTPEYLAAKLQTLRTFNDQPIILAVAERPLDTLPELAENAIVFKTRLKASDVLARLSAAQSDR